MGWIYRNTEDNSARFVLGVEGAKTLVCIGINPNTAVPGDLDNTADKVVYFTNQSGFDSWIMLNVYPLRALKPQLLPRTPDLTLHRQNVEHIQRILAEISQSQGQVHVWAGWGISIEERRYLSPCLVDIARVTRDFPCTWMALGELTKKGHPRHPSRVSYKTMFGEFALDRYLELRQAKQNL